MKKEEKIKEEWVKCVGEKNITYIMKNANEVTGFVEGFMLKTWNVDTNNNKLEKQFDGIVLNYRPKTLQGIENNNGWIKIESEDCLPKYVNNLWLLANDGSIILGQWCIFQNIFKTTYGNDFDTNGIKFTHYQPIIKPNPPIY